MNPNYDGDCCASSEEVSNLKSALGKIREGNKKPRILEALDENERNIDRLHEKVAKLIDKLNPVLKPAIPVDVEGKCAEKEMTSDLTRIIDEKSGRLQRIGYIIDDVLERIEI